METADPLKARVQLRGVAVSCQPPCLQATILSTGEFTQRVVRVRALIARHVCRWQTSRRRLSPVWREPKGR